VKAKQTKRAETTAAAILHNIFVVETAAGAMAAISRRTSSSHYTAAITSLDALIKRKNNGGRSVSKSRKLQSQEANKSKEFKRCLFGNLLNL
jgi:hypothetical protein